MHKGNVKLIAEFMSSFIQSDLFYCYIVYAINHKSAEQLITTHSEYFEHLRRVSGDLLGINSFFIQPIQKLPRYKMLFDEMIKELSRDVSMGDKEAVAAVAACCIAEKSLQRLLNRCNEAMYINDILETHVYSASVQLGTLMTMQRDFGVDIDEPLMILVPKTNSNFKFQSPVRLLTEKLKMFLNFLLFHFRLTFTAWANS
jgi:RhoGEF domain